MYLHILYLVPCMSTFYGIISSMPLHHNSNNCADIFVVAVVSFVKFLINDGYSIFYCLILLHFTIHVYHNHNRYYTTASTHNKTYVGNIFVCYASLRGKVYGNVTLDVYIKQYIISTLKYNARIFYAISSTRRNNCKWYIKAIYGIQGDSLLKRFI